MKMVELKELFRRGCLTGNETQLTRRLDNCGVSGKSEGMPENG
jgi:hypothetical protein